MVDEGAAQLMSIVDRGKEHGRALASVEDVTELKQTSSCFYSSHRSNIEGDERDDVTAKAEPTFGLSL